MYEILYSLERQELKFIFKSCLKNRAKRKVAVRRQFQSWLLSKIE